MKKVFALLMAGVMLASMTACGQDIGIIGGADGPTAIFVTCGESSGTRIPASIEHEYTYNDDEYCTYSMALKAFDENGALMWEYITPDSMVAQCESLEYLGMNNGLVYVNECGLFDEESMKNGTYEEQHRLRALNAADGSVAWENADYSGAGSSCVFDDAGNIYLAGYFGPDCMKIDRSGKTVWSVPGVDEELYWVYGLSLENDVITISYEMNENGEADTARVSVDGEILS